jgi:uncharacterized protein DUF3306
MSDQENFLARWSRRKREAEHEHAQDEAQKAALAADTDAEAAPTLEEECAEVVRAGAERKGDAAQAPAVDLTKLPPIESIMETTDIRPFLAAGVPEELKYAALRRAWVVDPAIRDFVGIAENQWDFTVPGGAPGFGRLLPVDDVRRLVAEVLGDQPEVRPIEASDVPVSRPQLAAVTRESAADVNEQQLRDPGATPESVPSHTHTSRSDTEGDVIVQASNADAASQDDAHDPLPKQSGRRTHGSALPE